MVLMVIAMVFEKQIGVPAVASVIVAGLVMVLTGCTRSVDGAYKMIGWESIVLIAGMMPMSTALSNTGISKMIAEGLVSSLQSMGPIAIMAGVSFLIRTLPLTLIRRPITNRFLRSFLFYVPYVTLAVMTFPAIVQATQSPLAGALALVLGIALAFNGASLFTVAASCCAVVLIAEGLLL